MPFVQVADVSDDMKLVDDTKQKISKLAQPMSVCAEEGSVLVTLQGSIGRVAIMQYKAFVDRTVLIFDKYNADIDKTFWAYIIKEKFIEEARKAPGGTIKTITKEVLSDFDLMLPSYDEQKMLGKLLHSLDHLITLHQCKCQIDGCRFQSPLAITWEQRKLGEIGSVSMCRRIFKEQTSENGEIPFYKIGTFGGEADAFISRELFEEYKAKYQYPKKGDILISASGSIGRTVVFTGKNEYFQDSNIVWLNHDKHLDNSFLKCFYSIVKWAGIEGSTIKRLYNDNILNTAITLPSVEEQQKIGAYFENLDNLITLHQCE